MFLIYLLLSPNTKNTPVKLRLFNTLICLSVFPLIRVGPLSNVNKNILSEKLCPWISLPENCEILLVILENKAANLNCSFI